MVAGIPAIYLSIYILKNQLTRLTVYGLAAKSQQHILTIREIRDWHAGFLVWILYAFKRLD